MSDGSPDTAPGDSPTPRAPAIGPDRTTRERTRQAREYLSITRELLQDAMLPNSPELLATVFNYLTRGGTP
jgi:hypothetical protein